jgi:hypothetical protein
MRAHDDSRQINWPLNCVQLNCSKTFKDVKSYGSHLLVHISDVNTNKNLVINRESTTLQNFSENSLEIDNKFIENQVLFTSDDNDFNNDDDPIDDNKSDFKRLDSNEKIKTDLKTKTFKLMNHFRSKHQLSDLLLNEIIKSFGDFISDLIDTVQDKMLDLFDLTDDKKEDFSLFYTSIANPFEFLATSYKQQKLLEQTGFYVAPKSINLGRREETTIKNGVSNNIYKDVTFEYVNIYETIDMLLKDSSYQDALTSFSVSKLNAKYYDEHNLFKIMQNLRIILYFDDLEMCNPLGDASGVYKAGMFYFTLANLTRKHYSNLKNIFLVATCHSDDLKLFGYNAVLDVIMCDIKKLETEGVMLRNQIVFGSIAQTIGDNLGIHQIFGIQQK